MVTMTFDVARRLRRSVRRLGGDQGTALLEMALTLPLLLFVAVAIFEFGRAFQTWEVLTNAAREGARVAVLPDFGTADVQNRVTSYLAASGLTDAAPAPTVSFTTSDVGVGGPSISTVTVTVQYPHQFILLTPLAALVGSGPHADMMLKAASTMRQEIAAAP
jgi:Flp pilus assembly protein TadG